MSLDNVQLVLASSSSRRKDLLESLGLSFQIVIPSSESRPNIQEIPPSYVLRMATQKGMDAIEQLGETEQPSLIIAADTIVSLNGTIFEKPTGKADARSMLVKLSGQTHEVLTGIYLCLVAGKQEWKVTGEVVTSLVTFKHLSAQTLEAYLDTGESLDKAGAYAIQGEGGNLVEKLEGSRSNVIGLPIERVTTLLKDFYGFDLPNVES